MVNNLLQLFKEYQDLAILLSICASIIIALLGVIPSVFITAANILFFGFWNGILISFLGEAMGAGISFLLYRKGFKKRVEKNLAKYPRLKTLIEAEDRKAFKLIFLMRFMPFVPSGLITFAAAVGKVSFLSFITASSLGKIPALLLEGYSVYEITQFGWQGKLILAVVAVVLIYQVIKKK